MPSGTGSLYRVRDRLYADSQAVLSLAGKHDLVQHAGGWRVLAGDGSVMCTMVEDCPPLPNQRGALYVLTAEGLGLKDTCMAWCRQGLMRPAGSYDAWPGAPASACSHGCACDPCRTRWDGGDGGTAAEHVVADGVTQGPHKGGAPPAMQGGGASRRDDPGVLLERAARSVRQGTGTAQLAAFVARARALGGTAERVARVVEDLEGLLRGDPVSLAIFRELLTLAELEQTLGVTLKDTVDGQFAADLRDSVAEVLAGLAAIPGLSTGSRRPEGAP